MRLLITGDRNWTDVHLIWEKLRDLPRDTVVVHGAARGADFCAASAAIQLDLKVEAHPANWEKYHRAAGPIRNQEMLDSKPDLVLAFHDDLAASKGTRDMVQRAIKAGLSVTWYKGDGTATELSNGLMYWSDEGKDSICTYCGELDPRELDCEECGGIFCEECISDHLCEVEVAID